MQPTQPVHNAANAANAAQGSNIARGASTVNDGEPHKTRGPKKTLGRRGRSPKSTSSASTEGPELPEPPSRARVGTALTAGRKAHNGAVVPPMYEPERAVRQKKRTRTEAQLPVSDDELNGNGDQAMAV